MTMPRPICDTRPRRGKHRARPSLADRARTAAIEAREHLHASARAARGTTVLCSSVLVVLVGYAGGARL
jgi:hypothetical protein